MGFIEGLGLLLAAAGALYATGPAFGFAGIESFPYHPLRAAIFAIALALCLLNGWGLADHGRRPAFIEKMVIGVSLTAGLLELWHAAAESGVETLVLHSWMGLPGCAAVLVATWRLRSPSLTIAGLLAIIHAATWHHGLDLSSLAWIDGVHEIGRTLWFAPDEGTLGWVSDLLLSTVLPVFLPGAVVAGLTFIGRSASRSGEGEVRLAQLTAAAHAVCRFLLPPLAVGSLIMMVRPGIDPMTILAAWALPVAIGLVWFRFIPVRDRGERASPRPGWRQAVTIGSVIKALAKAGIAFARLLILAGTVGMVLAALDRSDLPFDIARLLAGGFGEMPLPLALFAAAAAACFGMIMPAFAAYLIAVALFGPALRTVGLDMLALHLLLLFVSAGSSAIRAAQAASGAAMKGSAIGTALPGNAASR